MLRVKGEDPDLFSDDFAILVCAKFSNRLLGKDRAPPFASVLRRVAVPAAKPLWVSFLLTTYGVGRHGRLQHLRSRSKRKSQSKGAWRLELTRRGS